MEIVPTTVTLRERGLIKAPVEDVISETGVWTKILTVEEFSAQVARSRIPA